MSSSFIYGLYNCSLASISISPKLLVKLDDTNFMIWSEKSKHVLIVYELQGFLNGFEPILVKFINKFILEVGHNVTKTHEKL